MKKFSVTVSGESLSELQDAMASFIGAKAPSVPVLQTVAGSISDLKVDESPKRGRPKKAVFSQEEIDAQRKEVEAEERSAHSASEIRAEQELQTKRPAKTVESDPFGEDEVHSGASVTEFTHAQIIEIAKDLRDRKGVDAVKSALDNCGAKCVSIDPKKTGNIQPGQYAKFAQLAKQA